MDRAVDRALGGVVAAWLVVFGEFAVTVLSRPEFAGVWEVQYGSLWLAPSALFVAGAVGAVGGLGAALVESPSRAARVALSLPVAVFGAVVGWGVSSGRTFEVTWVRVLFVGAIGLVGLAGAWAAAPRVRVLFRATPGRALSGLAIVVALLEWVNATVLVRLYLPFHDGLAVATLALASLAPLGVRGARPRRATWRWGLCLAFVVALALLLVVAPRAAARLRHFDNYRLVMLDHAPLLGPAVRIAAHVAPEEERDSGEAACTSPSCRDSTAKSERLSLTGHDILLVTIDAVRADHVGAYGYGRNTTPNIDALARQGALFERAYCPSPHTSYSVTSLLTGKYMRPLLLQGAGRDSESLASLLRRYGFKTAAFYPPAVFFIDRPRFEPFERSGLGFEYRKVEFLEGKGRVAQVETYLASAPPDQRLLLWVHLFGPHEPYEAHDDYRFGDRDIDRYDSEIAAADMTVGEIVEAVRRRRRRVLVIVTSDHGEEFGDHGGRYHGTSVYEEQVRVPLVVSGDGVVAKTRVEGPVQTIDIMPTVLEGLDIPVPPRVRGRSLAPALSQPREDAELRTAFAETDGQTLLARGSMRLVCERKIGACRLYDISSDPSQKHDLASVKPDVARSLRKRLDSLTASHGAFEQQGLRAEGRGWPAAILRGIAGDADAAPELAQLLDDADVVIRRKAAELSFELGRADSAAALRLALQRDEDETVRRWCALGLTRLGEGAPLVRELLRSKERSWRRLAALALAEAGDKSGNEILVDWWMRDPPSDHERSLDLIAAFGRLRSKKSVWPLVQRLDDVRLRPDIAAALAEIGDDTARGPLVRALSRERYQGARTAIAQALVDLGAREELARPLIRFLGTPDPLPGGLGIALAAGITEHVGGPPKRQLRRLEEDAHIGATVRIVVPKGGNGSGFRLLVRGHSTGVGAGEVRVGRAEEPMRYDRKGMPVKRRNLPTIHPDHQLALTVPRSTAPVEVHGRIPDTMGLRPGLSVDLVVFAERDVALQGVAVVPLYDELPPPKPKPSTPETPGEGREQDADPVSPDAGSTGGASEP